MEPHLTEMLGPLRGHAEPPAHVMERLHALSPNYRVTWTPPTELRMAMWWVSEVRPNTRETWLRQKAGDARVQRIKRWAVAAQERRRADLWQAEEQALGFWPVGNYAEAYFGTPAMLAELEAGHRALQAIAHGDLAEATRKAAEAEIREEEEQNAEFRQYVRDVARDWWPLVVRRPQVGYEPSSRSSNATGTHG